MTFVGGLERILGKETAQKVIDSKTYNFCADAVAMNLFSLSYGLNEHFRAGYSWADTLNIRLAAAVGNALTGTPYRKWNEFVIKELGVTKESHWSKKYGADVVAFATGQTPLYVLYCLFGGADYGQIADGISNGDVAKVLSGISVGWNPEKIKNAATFLTAVAPALGTPQRLTYDVVRDQLGLKKTYTSKEK
jgi:hypothetical protein